MSVSSLQISLLRPQVQQIQLNNQQMHAIGLNTPVAYGTAKLSIDTSVHWAERLGYIPKYGEIVVYSDRRVIEGVNYPGVKIGDGRAYGIDLPFVGDDSCSMIMNILEEHLSNMELHVSPEDRANWNNKVSCDIDGERLIFERTDSNG